MNMKGVEKIISGGQTGVDQGALEFALSHGVVCDGYCPKGRMCEDGRIPDRYPLTELMSEEYEARTLKNVRESDGTLVLVRDGNQGEGTRLTIHYCQELKKPFEVLDMSMDRQEMFDMFIQWLEDSDIRVLNVAGNRESHDQGIHEETIEFLEFLFEAKKVIS